MVARRPQPDAEHAAQADRRDPPTSAASVGPRRRLRSRRSGLVLDGELTSGLRRARICDRSASSTSAPVAATGSSRPPRWISTHARVTGAEGGAARIRGNARRSARHRAVRAGPEPSEPAPGRARPSLVRARAEMGHGMSSPGCVLRTVRHHSGGMLRRRADFPTGRNFNTDPDPALRRTARDEGRPRRTWLNAGTWN